MRDKIFKFLPIVFGLTLGWMLFHPPAWLEALGPLGYVVHAGVCALLVLSVSALMIVSSLPAQLRMEPLRDADVPPDLAGLSASLQQLGFHVAGPPWKVNVAPSAMLLGFVHASEPVYATAYRTDTVPSKTSFDFVSLLDGERGGLTSMVEPGGAALPEGPGGFRQVLPDRSPADLYRAHLEGLAWLRDRGMAARAVSPGQFQEDFTRAMARQRALVLASPLRSTWVTFWRAATKQVPFVGTLAQQPFAQQQLARLSAG